MAMRHTRSYTVQEVLALPSDGNRYEVVHGKLLVTPAPRFGHQELVARLLEQLRAYLRREPVGHALASPADITWDSRTLVQPDVFVTTLPQARMQDWAHVKTLLLAIEVVSPSSARADRVVKRRLYREQHVTSYWIVDGPGRSVEIWTPNLTFPTLETDRLVWHPAGATAPLTIDLAELFSPI